MRTTLIGFAELAVLTTACAALVPLAVSALAATGALGKVGRHNLASGARAPAAARAFAPFESTLGISWDDEFVYIEGNGLPQHGMMTGITAWQQQVPIPHDFTGPQGAFRIPIDPKPLETAQELTLLGPIAIAVNGIPIFHSLTQSGKDAREGGELDRWGGHCGRADDYHYHIAPGHLEEIVGKGSPVAYGLDGFPVYMADPKKDKPLDEAHGYFDDDGNYRYVSGDTAPYMMAMFRGAVDLDIRPRTRGVRPHLPPLRGAVITGFEGTPEDGYRLSYELGGKTGTIDYRIKADGSADFVFKDVDGTVREEKYDGRRQGGGGERPPGSDPGRGKGAGRGRKGGEGGVGGSGGGRSPEESGAGGGIVPPSPQAHQSEADLQSAHREGGGLQIRPTLSRAPNVVLFCIDDMGWRDVGFAGNEYIETPHTDRLAREGVIFTNAYASAPNCAPSRACLMSGQYTPRHGVYTVVDDRHAPGSPHHRLLAAHSNESMATGVVTIAEQLKAGGYGTAMFGMWNLGRGSNNPVSPEGQGFDVFLQPRDVGFDKDRYFNERGEYLTDRFTDEGLKYIERHRKEPFFVYFAYHAVHAPWEPKPELLAKYERKANPRGEEPAYAATVEAVDRNVGRVMETLERLGLDGNTVVIFTSDNGGNRRHTAPLRDGKGTLYEGGIRVPACVWGPRAGIARGLISGEPVLGLDFYPTLLDLAGLDSKKDPVFDGRSLVPLLEGSSQTLGRDRVFWHFPCYIGGGGPSSAIRKGDWKLIEFFEGERIELYNLAMDPGEENDLSKRERAKAEELYADLRAWQKKTGAALVTEANPAYDPNAEPKRGRDERGKGKRN